MVRPSSLARTISMFGVLTAAGERHPSEITAQKFRNFRHFCLIWRSNGWRCNRHRSLSCGQKYRWGFPAKNGILQGADSHLWSFLQQEADAYGSQRHQIILESQKLGFSWSQTIKRSSRDPAFSMNEFIWEFVSTAQLDQMCGCWTSSKSHSDGPWSTFKVFAVVFQLCRFYPNSKHLLFSRT